MATTSIRLSPRSIPKAFPVRPILNLSKAKEPVTCGTCGLSWDDAIATAYTPAPSARCPFEQFHRSAAAAKVVPARSAPVVGEPLEAALLRSLQSMARLAAEAIEARKAGGDPEDLEMVPHYQRDLRDAKRLLRQNGLAL